MPVYLLAEIEITNPEGYKAYTALVPATLEKFGGRFLVRGGKAHPLEGDWPDHRRVLIEFPTMELATQWWDSPDYQKPKALRRANSKGRLVFLEGI